MPIRITGPYRHPSGGWRCRVYTGPGAYTWTRTFSDADEDTARRKARADAEGLAEGLQEQVDLTVGGLVERYEQHQRALGRRAGTLTATRDAIVRLVGCWSHREAAHITAAQAKARYLELVAAPGAVRSQHEALSQTKAMWRWAIEEGLMRESPWAAVKKLGKARKGKPQLTMDETARLGDACLRAAAKDDGALGVLIAMHMGLRSSEIVSRTVRDVDGGGTYLRVGETDQFETKTEAGKRPLRIPEVLRPLVAARCVGRSSHDRLLATAALYKCPRNWLRQALARWCKAAGVPVVCPHGLRGGWATIAYEAGITPELVAAALGHTTSKITEAHYAQPQAVAESQRKQRERWLKPV